MTILEKAKPVVAAILVAAAGILSVLYINGIINTYGDAEKALIQNGEDLRRIDKKIDLLIEMMEDEEKENDRSND